VFFGRSYNLQEDFKTIDKFKLNTSKNIRDFGKNHGFEQSVYLIHVQSNNILEGEFDYPIPVAFQYLDNKTRQVYRSSTFFLDTGSYRVSFQRMVQSYQINLNSPVNNEFTNFKKLFEDLYTKGGSPFWDSLTDINEKEKRIAAYVKHNPDSYVALWEIFHDYCEHDYYPFYSENLQLFSEKMKNNALFKKLETRLKFDSASHKGNRFELSRIISTGSEFPDVKFDTQHVLTKEDFKKYKLTFIDFWSTSCGPCIKAMPEIVAMYNEYKNKGVNFITVTDEYDPKRIELAKNILKQNKAIWTNYFDSNKVFYDKFGILSWPTQFLVDQNGKIVTRFSGDLDAIKKAIDNYLK
jgi:thiol-disulfide isomerase/thioredoxin